MENPDSPLTTTNNFGYNVRSEVVEAFMGTNTYGYAYDPIGNRRAATNNAEILTYLSNELNLLRPRRQHDLPPLHLWGRGRG
jgi:hypothetical protein